jgi:hypothetical protein
MSRLLTPFAVALFALRLLAVAQVPQDPAPRPAQAGNTAQGPGAPGTRETMWPAPTAEDWKRPVLVEFQRTWDDALAVARLTGKPILACVNMDGEPASEHYAGIRYRQPDIAKLYEAYVCVIASVYRHNARDYDEQGRRILCPRFGSCTCGEHIALEPFLYEKFLDGVRVAPRHIMVELGGNEAAPTYKESYDVYYANDTASVFQQIKDGVVDYPKPLPLNRDKSLLEKIGSRDIQDRTAVENAYLQADAKQKAAMLDQALAQAGKAAPVDLLRLAVFGLDVDLARKARLALANCDSENATDLIVEALRVPLDGSEREQLVGTLVRIGQKSPRAKLLANVHLGLGSRSTALDLQGWSKAIETADPTMVQAPQDLNALESRLQYSEASTKSRDKDPQARLELAESTLAFALERAGNPVLLSRGTANKHVQLLYEDALREAKAAESLGAKGWRLNALLAVSSWNLGKFDDAYARAEAAVTGMPADAGDRISLNAVLVFAEARQQAIADAVRAKKDWPPQWLTDLNAAYSVLARHPLGTDVHIAAHYDFLLAIGGKGTAVRVLDDGLQRFPESWTLHDRLRARVLAEQGPEALERRYAEWPAQEKAPRHLAWFAGYAALIAAEAQRRTGALDLARAAYDRAIGHYDRLIVEDAATKPNADHYAALALAGKARMSLEQGNLDQALTELLASFARKPEAAATLDGLNLSPADTSRTLRARLIAADRKELVAQLDLVLAKMDPELLKLPAYERPAPGARPFGRRRGG